ncbi:hypothetical protein [Nocardioides sambongensis]|uniref:hypothetical protein n=1 Tax=Nocardioides sambongensis TaxID=2589074 RepID=UPI0018C8892E|nr:hypothetical protein [Nocardioides sambongensis]
MVDQLERARYVTREIERIVEAEWEAHLGVERMTALRDALHDLRALTDPWS